MLDASIVSKPKLVKQDGNLGVFEIENLYAGYGITLGNALRRVLLSSLPGAAVTQVKIKGVDHEFSTIAGVVEDVVEILLNLKKLRFKLHSDETQLVTLRVSGERTVTGADIEENQNIEVMSKDFHIATLTSKKVEFEMELKVERGLGYEPVEMRKKEKLPIGTVALDAFFSPVKKVNFVSDNMRVGDRTDYNRIRLVVETDGSITPSQALQAAAKILLDHYAIVASVDVEGVLAKGATKEKKTAKKKTIRKKK